MKFAILQLFNLILQVFLPFYLKLGPEILKSFFGTVVTFVIFFYFCFKKKITDFFNLFFCKVKTLTSDS